MNNSVVKLHGVSPLLHVYDMRTSLDFYCEKLGFTLIWGADAPDYTWALIRLNGVDLMMEPKYRKDKRPEAPDPHPRDAVLYFGCSNIDETYAHLRAQGVETQEPAVAPYGMKQLYFSDPDGFLLCFQYPATQEMFDAWQKWYGHDYRKPT